MLIFYYDNFLSFSYWWMVWGKIYGNFILSTSFSVEFTLSGDKIKSNAYFLLLIVFFFYFSWFVVKGPSDA
jgi:hypothetical protein